MTVLRRLPGITFQAEVPPPPEILPRMDITGFVGLAATGPLHTPVLIEDIKRFRDIFGPDLPLAWDAEIGQTVYAHLGQSVELYFRNGGQRCWVVRVAQVTEATKMTAFPLPGVWRVDSNELETAVIHARCYGSWFDDLRVGTCLNSETFQIEFLPDSPPSESTLSARVTGNDIAPGDLLRIDEDDLHLFLAIESAEAETDLQGQRIEGRPYWITDLSSESPPYSEEVAWIKTAPISLSSEIRAALRLTFDIWVWREERLIGHLDDLGFLEDHPRCWQNLFTDQSLFALRDKKGNPRKLTPFQLEIAEPRFPLAFTGKPNALYLPLAMEEIPIVENSLGPQSPTDILSKLERDGLATFNTEMFLDDELANVGRQALSAAANDKYYVRGEELTGIHALLPLEEVSIVAIPDAGQPGWHLKPSQPINLLPAPKLLEVKEEGAQVKICWQHVRGATDYVVETAECPDFTTPKSSELTRKAVSFEEPTKACLHQPLPTDCPRRFYVRIYAKRGGERSPWSNTIGKILPQEPFVTCESPIMIGPTLSMEEHQTKLRFEWTPANGYTHYRWQSATWPDFINPKSIVKKTRNLEVSRLPSRVTYYRVRAENRERIGQWSNTVTFIPELKSVWLMDAPTQIAARLITIQRALLRFCAARGNLFALLSLPSHFRADDAIGYKQALLIRCSGEGDILSYGAMYHPWLITPMPETDLRAAQPPDGAVCGLYAQRAIERGAWVAPANDPLADIVLLSPPLSTAVWQRLYDNQINQILAHPRGFLSLSADTLSLNPDLQPVNVRRLLLLLRRLALREGQTYVFEPNSPTFRRLVHHRFNQLLGDLFTRGAFSGATPSEAYRVVTDSSVNTPQSIDQGRFIVELWIAPSQPLAFITVRLIQTERAGLTLTEV